MDIFKNTISKIQGYFNPPMPKGEKTYNIGNAPVHIKQSPQQPVRQVQQATPTPTAQPMQQAQPAQTQMGDYVSQELQGYAKGKPLPSQDILALIVKAAQQEHIKSSLLAALLRQESGFNPKALNPGSGDYGIAQINLKSHPGITEQQAYDPNFAIPFAAHKLAADIQYFGDPSRGIAAYNVGRGGASIDGPEPYGGGPKGQYYIDNVIRNLDPEFIKQMGLKPSQRLLDEYSQ